MNPKRYVTQIHSSPEYLNIFQLMDLVSLYETLQFWFTLTALTVIVSILVGKKRSQFHQISKKKSCNEQHESILSRLFLKALTHQGDSRPSVSVGPSVSICCPGFYSVSRTISPCLLFVFWQIQHAELALEMAEPVGSHDLSQEGIKSKDSFLAFQLFSRNSS